MTAVSDSDGQPGGTGGNPACEPGEFDDTPASFSNFASTAGGAVHTIAGPGVCITSTWLGGTYNTISGTSMATPHLAGEVALCINETGTAGPCAGKTPAQIISYLRSDAQTYNTANPSYGFAGDPGHGGTASQYYGYLTRTQPPPAACGNVCKSGPRWSSRPARAGPTRFTSRWPRATTRWPIPPRRWHRGRGARRSPPTRRAARPPGSR